MPAFISKVLHPSYPGGKKPNPYTSQYHPNHNPPPSSPFTSPWNRNQQQQGPDINAQSPLNDSNNLLAEARQSAGRDPITGNLVPRLKNPLLRLPAHKRSQQQRGRPATTTLAGERPRGEEGSAYNNTIAGRRATSGSRYDLFVQEMKETQKMALGRAVSGYYAPTPKPAVEYYAPDRREPRF